MDINKRSQTLLQKKKVKMSSFSTLKLEIGLIFYHKPCTKLNYNTKNGK